MKSYMKKALALVMMLAMVAGIIAVPNVDAKASDTKKIVLVLSNPTSNPVLFDLDCYGNGEDGNLTTTAEVADTSWGRNLYTMTKESDTVYSITLSGPLDKKCCAQIVLENKSCGFKFYIHDNKDVWNSTDTLYLSADNSGNFGWDTQLTASAVDPNAATAADVMAVIDAIGTVELSDACKAKIEAAETAVKVYSGNASDITNMDKLTAAKAKWQSLMTTDAAGKVTVYVKADSWESVHLYGWDSDDNSVTKTWPGTQLTAMKENAGWYSCTFDITEAVNILFNEKGEDAKKTGDWKYFTAGTYWVTIADDNNYTSSKTAPEGWTTEEASKIELEIPNKGIETTVVVYAVLLAAGLGMVAFASKKRFAK